MTRYFCDVCGMETTDERAGIPPRAKATVNGKEVWLHLDMQRDKLGFPLHLCAGCLMIAVDTAEWILDPSELIKEIAA